MKRCAELVEKSEEVVHEALKKFTSDELAITWTGGKDSTLTLWIIRKVCQEDSIKLPKVMTIDEYDSFTAMRVRMPIPSLSIRNYTKPIVRVKWYLAEVENKVSMR